MPKKTQLVLQVLKDNPNRCFEAKELWPLCRQYTNSIGIASVYRALSILTQRGLVRKIQVGERRYCYMLQNNRHISFFERHDTYASNQ